MKKAGIVTIAAILLTSLAGCSGNTAAPAQQEQATEPAAGLANPWNYEATAQDVKDLTGRELIIPDGATDISYAILDIEKMGEVSFTLDGKHYSARLKVTEEYEDISALYYEWDADGVDVICGYDADVRQNFADTINNVLWSDGSIMYSVYTSDGDNDSTDVLETARLLVTPSGADGSYDMYGYVVDKLPEDEYSNHYNVKGDNDEIFICNYNGNDELAEGTYVGMLEIGDGWTIEVIDD